MGIGLSHKAPVPLAPKVQLPLIRFHDAWHVVAAACLKQQHADIRVLGESARYHRTGGTRSANNEIVMRLQLSPELPLIHTYSLNELRRLCVSRSTVLHMFYVPVCFSEISLAQPHTVGQSMNRIGDVLRIVDLPLPRLPRSLLTAKRNTSMAI